MQCPPAISEDGLRQNGLKSIDETYRVGYSCGGDPSDTFIEYGFVTLKDFRNNKDNRFVKNRYACTCTALRCMTDKSGRRYKLSGGACDPKAYENNDCNPDKWPQLKNIPNFQVTAKELEAADGGIKALDKKQVYSPNGSTYNTSNIYEVYELLKATIAANQKALDICRAKAPSSCGVSSAIAWPYYKNFDAGKVSYTAQYFTPVCNPSEKDLPCIRRPVN